MDALMTLAIITIVCLGAYFAGWKQGGDKRESDIERESRNLSVARQKGITDAINDSKAGGAADPSDWLKRLHADNQRNGNL